jgi:hypothetical protein
MDKLLRAEIINEVRRAEREAHEGYEERWVTDKTLSQYVETMTPRWLRSHGHLLGRTRQIVTSTTDGTETKSPWVYPLNKILRMAHDGELKGLIE